MFTNKNFHQGDSQFFGIAKVPNGAKKIEKRYIAASKRSGSFHALFGNYEDGLVIEAHDECILNHSLQSLLQGTGVTLDKAQVIEKKDHRHSVIPKGVYYVGIQQRFDPLSGIKKRVQD